MAGEIVYADLNLPGARPSPSLQARKSPQCPRWHGIVLKVGCAGIVVLLVTVAALSVCGGSRCKLCPMEWMLHDDKCYWVSKELNIWSKSRDDCSKKRSQMLVFQDWEEMDYLQLFMPDDNPFWIGLTFNSSEKKWTWVDGGHVKEELFPGVGQAEERSCGILQRKKADFEFCENKLKWICKKAAFLL